MNSYLIRPMEFWLYHFLPAVTVAFLFLIGFFGSFLPIIPGTIVVWLAILIDKLWTGEDSVSWDFFWLATGLMIFAQVVDLACTYWGVKKFGGTWRGGVGAIVGLILGPFIFIAVPLLGLIIGPIIGAILGECLGGKELKKAGKAGFGTVVGGLVAFVIKIAIVCFMIGGFYYNVSSFAQTA